MLEINLDILSSASLIRLFEAVTKIRQYDSNCTRIEATQWELSIKDYFQLKTGQDIEVAVQEKHDGIRKLHPKQ